MNFKKEELLWVVVTPIRDDVDLEKIGAEDGARNQKHGEKNLQVDDNVAYICGQKDNLVICSQGNMCDTLHGLKYEREQRMDIFLLLSLQIMLCLVKEYLKEDSLLFVLVSMCCFQFMISVK